MGSRSLVIVAAVLATAVPVGAAPLPSAAQPGPAAEARADAGHDRAVRPTPRCQGRPATIVGPNARYDRIRGTDGPDVVVTGRADVVRTGAGRDLVCVTGRRAATVVAGPGADRVVGAGTSARVTVDLGSGPDVFVGGAGDDRVIAGPDTGPETQDVVRTGGGDDAVSTIGTRRGTRDVVALGVGDDRVDVGVGTVGDARVLGGPGADYLNVELVFGGPAPVGDLVVDARTGTGTRGGRPWLRFAGMEDFRLPNPAGSTLEFTGSAADESLVLSAGDNADAPSYAGSADMGGGDDEVVVPLTGREVEARSRTLRGGAGDDVLRVASLDPTLALRVDGAAGQVSAPGAGTVGFDGFETYAPSSRGPLTVVGGDRDEQVLVSSCGATVQTGGGADRVATVPIPVYDDYADPGCYREAPPREQRQGRGPLPPIYLIDGPLDVDAGPGDDVVTGSRSGDRLVGGDGTDSIDGAGGDDTCTGERVARCER